MINFPSRTLNVEENFTVAIKQGGSAEAESDGDNEAIDGTTSTAAVLIADWFLTW